MQIIIDLSDWPHGHLVCIFVFIFASRLTFWCLQPNHFQFEVFSLCSFVSLAMTYDALVFFLQSLSNLNSHTRFKCLLDLLSEGCCVCCVHKYCLHRAINLLLSITYTVTKVKQFFFNVIIDDIIFHPFTQNDKGRCEQTASAFNTKIDSNSSRISDGVFRKFAENWLLKLNK